MIRTTPPDPRMRFRSAAWLRRQHIRRKHPQALTAAWVRDGATLQDRKLLIFDTEREYQEWLVDDESRPLVEQSGVML